MEVDPVRERVLRVLKRHGWNATSFQVLEPDFHYWLDGEDALVAYVDTGKAWVAAGAPVCAPDKLHETAEKFIAEAAANGRRTCFFATEQRFSDATSFPALLVGEQPVWDPRHWQDTLKQSRSLREQLRRARAAGVTIRELVADEHHESVRPELEALIRRWLGSRDMAPMGFLVQVTPFSFEEERRYFVAEQEGKPVAFLAAVPVYARSGWLFDDLIRAPEAPNGTAELLVDAAMRAVAERGSSYVTLGLVPLAGPVEGWLRVARKGARPLYDFKGLHRFKAKFRPQSWEPLFLSFPAHRSGTVALYDSLAAFARGGFVRFGLETLTRGPTLAIQLLAILLIPWIAILATASATRWFPSPGVKWAWVIFDIFVAAGLFALSQRWRHWLATLLATLITMDAALTFVEAMTFNARRVHTLFEWCVIGVAMMAPASAAMILWSGRAHRTRHLR